MKTGVVAILDVLGFKGIWERENPIAVVEKLKGLQDRAHEMIIGLRQKTAESAFEHNIMLLSDTIVIGTWTSSENQPLNLHVTLLTSAWVFTNALATGSPPLLLRGAIAAGQFLMDDRFVIGPAIDEAAEGEKKAKAAAIWLCPTAMDVVRRHTFPERPPLLEEYDLPVAGEPIRTAILDPFCQARRFGEEEVDRLITLAMKTMRGMRADVVKKRLNTQALLARAKSSTASEVDPDFRTSS